MGLQVGGWNARWWGRERGRRVITLIQALLSRSARLMQTYYAPLLAWNYSSLQYLEA